MPATLPPTQMVSTCGTVISMVMRDRTLRIFSKPPTDADLCDGLTCAQSGGCIVIVDAPAIRKPWMIVSKRASAFRNSFRDSGDGYKRAQPGRGGLSPPYPVRQRVTIFDNGGSPDENSAESRLHTGTMVMSKRI